MLTLEAQPSHRKNMEGEIFESIKVTDSYNVQPEGKRKGVMIDIASKASDAFYPYWSVIEFNLFGIQLLNKRDPMLFIPRSIGVSLTLKMSLIVSPKRTRLVTAGLEQDAIGLMQTRKQKFNPKRNGLGPA